MIKPDFLRDEELAALPLEARLLFAGLWMCADREGRIEDRPQRIKVDCLQLCTEMRRGRVDHARPRVDRPSGARVIQRGAGDGGQNQGKYPDGHSLGGYSQNRAKYAATDTSMAGADCRSQRLTR